MSVSAGQVAKKVKQGQTLGELEDEEGGPIKESMAGIAQSQRATKRKGGGVGDADLVQDVQRVEEDLEVEEEGGIKLEAFNLKVWYIIVQYIGFYLGLLFLASCINSLNIYSLQGH